jgi:hypothetical protein
VIFWKSQNFGDSKKIIVVRGQWGGNMNRRNAKDF